MKFNVLWDVKVVECRNCKERYKICLNWWCKKGKNCDYCANSNFRDRTHLKICVKCGDVYCRKCETMKWGDDYCYDCSLEITPTNSIKDV